MKQKLKLLFKWMGIFVLCFIVVYATVFLEAGSYLKATILF